jgi:hypothetical protein
MNASRTYTLLGADGMPYQSATKGQLGGHRKTRSYGRLDHPTALRAIAAGYRPCATSCPDRYSEWKEPGSSRPR